MTTRAVRRSAVLAASFALALSACGRGQSVDEDDGTPPVEEEDPGDEQPTSMPELIPPEFSACSPTSAPTTPSDWMAVSLMHPFDNSEVVQSVTWFSESERAMASVGFGVQGGGYDIFTEEVAGETLTYVIIPTLPTPICYGPAAGFDWQIPTTSWVGGSSDTCVGEAPLMTTDVQWWRTPNETITNGASWYWFTADSDRRPWRTMFAAPTDMAIFGQYSMSYFTTFESAPINPIGDFRTLCAAPEEMPAEWGSPTDLTELMAALPPREGESAVPEIGGIIPEVDYAACEDYDLPTFPAQFGMTTFMTPVNRNFAPYPTTVYYDASLSTPSMRTRMFWTGLDSDPNTYAEDAMLLGNQGYTIDRHNDGSDSCQQNLPGIPIQTWMHNDHCTCGGIIEPNDQLSPGRETMIISCPIDDPQWFWMWYTVSGEPVTFMETYSNADGTGLSLADYYEFEPGWPIDPSIYTLPSDCSTSDAMDRFHHSTADAADGGGPPQQCWNCHSPVNDPWVPPM